MKRYSRACRTHSGLKNICFASKHAKKFPSTFLNLRIELQIQFRTIRTVYPPTKSIVIFHCVIRCNSSTTKTSWRGAVKLCTRYIMEFVMKHRRRCFRGQYDRYDTKPAKQMYEYPESDLSLAGRTLAWRDVTLLGEFFWTVHTYVCVRVYRFCVGIVRARRDFVDRKMLRNPMGNVTRNENVLLKNRRNGEYYSM